MRTVPPKIIFIVGFLLVVLVSTTAFDAPGSPRAYALIDGSWSGTTSRGHPMSFTVSGGQWSTFALTTNFIATTCYNTAVTTTITVPGPGAITLDHFSYTSSTYSFSGDFTSATTASGSYSFTNRLFVIGLPFAPWTCNYYLTQSGTWSASIPPPAPGDFTKISPSDAAVDLSIPLTLNWNSSTYADSYQYCVDADLVPNSTCDTSWVDVGSATSASPAGLTPNTTYYWQVQAANTTSTTGADSGTWWAFTTLPAPGAFGKSAPANSSTNQLVDLTLSWTPSENATGYVYCIDTLPNDTCDTSWSPVAGTSVIPGLAWMVVYSWQVRAVGGGSTDADGGTWWTFATGPEPPGEFSKTAPTNAATGQTLTPTISWSLSPGASTYEYCYYSTNAADCDEPWTHSTGSGSVGLSGLAANTTYHWQVRARNTSGVTPANSGSWWSFTTLPAPGAFGKSAPASASSNQLIDVTLSWTPSANATDYVYCIDTFPNGTCDTSWSPVAGTSVIPGLAWTTVYFWQVRALGNGSTDADGGAWWSFATGPEPPADFSKTAPLNGSANQSTTPTLYWNPSPGVSSYEYCYYSTDSTDCNEPWTLSTLDTSLSLSGLTANTTYHWQVRARNTSGVTPANSGAWWTFTTLPDPPSAFGKSAPADASVNQSLSPTLSWSASSGVSLYEYCYYSTNATDCSEPWGLSTSDTSVPLSGLTAGTTYHWQVRAYNPAATTPSDSGTWWTFTTLPVPGAFGKVAPANFSHNNPSGGITLSWNSSANATGYEYCIETYLENVTAACDTSWQAGITATSVSLPLYEWDQIYYWQVRAVGGGTTEADGDGAFWYFDTAYMEPPSAFSKISPLNSAFNVSLTPTLSWEASNNSTYYGYCYYTSNPADCAGTWSLTTTGTSAGLSGLIPNTTYHWGVRACNDIWCIDAGPEEWWTFTTLPAPGAFGKSTPANDSLNQPLNPTLSWTANSNTDVYLYCLDKETVNNSTCDTSWVSALTATSVPLSGLSPNSTYYWQVRATGGGGTTEADSGTWWKFKTRAMPAVFYSGAAQDGWILESTETSNVGGTLDAASPVLNLGDEAGDKQYRSILLFNTAILPDNAVITKVTLKIKKQGLVGMDPFSILGALRVDVRMPYFGTGPGLAASDFQALVSRTWVGTFGPVPAYNWYSAVMVSAGHPYINKTGPTQFRLYFAKDDNDDGGPDYMKFFSGNYATEGVRPTLVIQYYIP